MDQYVPPFNLRFKIQEELIFSGTYYKDRRAGCFQQYVTVPSHTVLPLPSNLSFESAACLGVAGLTAAMTLWRWLEVPMAPQPSSPTAEYLLLWGGSTVTGQFAIQIAIRCGLEVIAITSSKTQSLAQSLGANHVIARDGKTEDEIISEIRSIAGDNITRAIDLVGTTTASYCLQAFSTKKKCIFAPLAMISSKAVIPENVRVETVEMKQFVLNPESRVYALELNRLVEGGQIKLPDVEVLEGGLDVVTEGLERLKRGDMKGKKIVVKMV
jgi:NADPH:quinone reductase-like Zn-dependent oxidoreductase